MINRLAVGVSGKGSNLAAMIEAKIPIELVFADRHCIGNQIATDAGIPVEIVQRPLRILTADERVHYTRQFMERFESHKINVIAMAGFMMIFDRVIFTKFENRILNLHPALLPSFKGEHAVRDALAFGVKITGTTVHVATEVLDEGPIIAQEAVRVLPTDTVESLHERIKIVERRMYPQAVAEFITRQF